MCPQTCLSPAYYIKTAPSLVFLIPCQLPCNPFFTQQKKECPNSIRSLDQEYSNSSWSLGLDDWTPTPILLNFKLQPIPHPASPLTGFCW